ncbi:D-alanyl-D-alanine carboxypeptidase (penicillin-binding protein 5/6) [Proteiniborus ethanoligenes]|uniref:serine-type D-Ala-D-Ala carboxypeptidase n=1 Tax=Proteiniborus ethanoligenes TaxID=415015 RepID=A0A1H3S906_9FIRM|nr:D-alanyl-D-alanine carboxypeptidase family protein [Proteiniborus ethanoligenes]SDZ34526.1 D-alanyl-D-alanine carboxypeptidase (penicillin-binding protein 5/6) [Proteiniborus ethanoligenes]
MKKIILFFLLIFFIFNAETLASSYEPDISAEAAILIDADTGMILFEKNANQSMFPASTTKILTGIIAIEKGSLEKKIVVDKATPYEINGSHIALEPDEVLTMKDLIYATLIESANDAATVIGKDISGSTEEFAKLMNSRAKEMGAKNTNFTNANGLPDDNHTTTAYDLAMIAKYAMQNELFRDIVSNYLYTIEPTNKKTDFRYLRSSNKLLYSTEKINVNGNSVPIKYEGANGIKTGYTVQAQSCLVASAHRNGQNLISVVLKANGNNVYIDTHKLLNYGFDNFSNVKVAFKNEFIDNIDVENGDKPFVTGIVGSDLFNLIPKGKEAQVKKNIILPQKISAPVNKGQVIGRIELTLDNKIIGTCNIVSAMEVNQKAAFEVVNIEGSSILKKWWFWLIFLFIVWRTYIELKRRKIKKRRRQSYLYSKF